MYEVHVTAGARKGQVRAYATRKAASRAADRLDLEYGAICAQVRIAPLAASEAPR